MAKHRYTKEEVKKWYQEHHTVIYFNKDDRNVFVRKAYGIGFRFNYANPIAWMIIVILIAFIVSVFVFRDFYAGL